MFDIVWHISRANLDPTTWHIRYWYSNIFTISRSLKPLRIDTSQIKGARNACFSDIRARSWIHCGVLIVLYAPDKNRKVFLHFFALHSMSMPDTFLWFQDNGLQLERAKAWIGTYLNLRNLKTGLHHIGKHCSLNTCRWYHIVII